MSKVICRLFFVVFTLVVFTVPCAAQEFERAEVELVKQSGRSITFSIEIADTLEKRQKGLMRRTHLPWKQGMLFDFEEDQVMAMWMKNTYVSLDMFFIDAEGVIFRIVENTEPDTSYTISSMYPGRYVLEVLAGTTQRFGIKTGDVIVLPGAKGKN